MEDVCLLILHFRWGDGRRQGGVGGGGKMVGEEGRREESGGRGEEEEGTGNLMMIKNEKSACVCVQVQRGE